ncbi:DUF3221 domain-containing protein [Paenibacillus sp. FJAT-26967]|uniref:DUF3221 domain-containing protein n=1 Tax=Paenibacillus sp. FJAT-26967 TaxID=1729690 RepID=UPI0008391CB5|nr:DUF3221 domain-containing protein [Paenibacillus sp. FJAT-26967]
MFKKSWLFLILIFIAACSTQPEESIQTDITGIITAINKEKNQILVIDNKKKKDITEKREAMWVSMDKNGELIVDGSTLTDHTFNKEILGRKAMVWIDGIILKSDPPQTFASKLIVE